MDDHDACLNTYHDQHGGDDSDHDDDHRRCHEQHDHNNLKANRIKEIMTIVTMISMIIDHNNFKVILMIIVKIVI